MINSLATFIKPYLRRHGLDIAHHLSWRSILNQSVFLVDVGANRGQTYSYFRRLGFNRMIFSFEPCPETFKILSAKKGRCWEKHQIALGESQGTVGLNIDPLDDGSNSLLRRHHRKSKNWVQVEMKRLDETPLPPGDFFLKVDAEGTDLSVFKGAQKLWSRLTGVMLEVSLTPRFAEEPTFVETLNYMNFRGFNLAFFDRQYPDGDTCLAVDAVFIR